MAVVELRKNYRQKGTDFMDLPNGVRTGNLPDEHQRPRCSAQPRR